MARKDGSVTTPSDALRRQPQGLADEVIAKPRNTRNTRKGIRLLLRSFVYFVYFVVYKEIVPKVLQLSQIIP